MPIPPCFACQNGPDRATLCPTCAETIRRADDLRHGWTEPLTPDDRRFLADLEISTT